NPSEASMRNASRSGVRDMFSLVHRSRSFSHVPGFRVPSMINWRSRSATTAGKVGCSILSPPGTVSAEDTSVAMGLLNCSDSIKFSFGIPNTIGIPSLPHHRAPKAQAGSITRRRAMYTPLRAWACTLAAVTLAAAGAPALSQEANWPQRPIRLVVGFVPGGGTDVSARIVSAKLSEVLNQQVVVENKPGASG